MTFVFLAPFIGGLLLAVRVMLFGVERGRSGDRGAHDARSIRFSLPLVSVFAIMFGLVGYGLSRSRGFVVAVTIGAAVGVLVSALSAWMVARWATIPPEHDAEDPRYALQGHPACVTTAIAPDRDGEITFDVGTERRVVRARLVGESSASTGTEVVIERIEDDVAYVEPWVQVEKRL